MATSDKILLGYGVVSVGAVPIGLTRGGSSFSVEREFREIEADGDRGPVKGRIVIDREVAKLTVNGLELFNADDMAKYYPGIEIESITEPAPTIKKMKSSLKIAEGDYNDVKWEGKTKDGKVVTITVENAINMDNLEWTLEDKNEVVAALGFTATYLEDGRETPPWSVDYAV